MYKKAVLQSWGMLGLTSLFLSTSALATDAWCPAGTTQNFLLNGSFEVGAADEGAPDWTGNNSISVSTGINPKPHGSQYAFTWTPETFYQDADISGVADGQAVKLSYYSGSHQPTDQSVSIQYLTAKGGTAIGEPVLLAVTHDVDDAGTLAQQELILGAKPAGANAVRVSVYGGTVDFIKVDAMCLYASDPPPPPPAACAKPLDPMLVTQYLEANETAPVLSSVVDDAAILGGERDMKVEKLQSDANYSSTFYVGDDGAGNGSIDFTNGSGDFSKATIVWDGNDNNADTLNPNGLGGVDLSRGDAFGMLVNSVDVERFKITLRIYSGAANVSESVFAYDNTQTGTSTNIPVTFSLATVAGSGADLTKVGAVELVIEPIDLTQTASGIDLNIGKFTAPCPVAPEITADLGDAPDTYKTTLATSGARHTIVAGLNLGAVVDAEADGQPNAAADGDGTDEDGVNFMTKLVPGEVAVVGVGTTQPKNSTAKLDAWIDFNGDGDFGDTGEQIATSQSITGGALYAQGSHALDVNVPADAKAGKTYARFRLSSAGGLSPEGDAADGEVEDYVVDIVQGATLGDYVWHDLDKNGVQDAGEPAVAGVLVNLLRVSDGVVVKSAFTDTQGAYLFTHLLPDTYQVEFVAPTGYSFTTATQGGDTAKDSNADTTTGRTATITLADGDNQREWDAGLVLADNTVVHCDAVPFKTTELSETLLLPKFDAALGTLTGVKVSAYGATRQFFATENSAAQTQKIKLVSTVDGYLTLPNATSVDTATAYDTGFKNLTVADGILDYRGTAAFALSGWHYATNSNTVDYTTLADFIAAAAGDKVSLPYETVSGLGTTGGGGNLRTFQRTTASVGACVTYLYEKKVPSTDLALTKVVDKPTVKRGDTVVYTLTITNTGANAATGVVVTDKLPAGVSHVSNDGDGVNNGSYDKASGVWTVGDIAKGASKTLKLTVKVN